jgi:hypothetical protein
MNLTHSVHLFPSRKSHRAIIGRMF